MIKSVVRQFHWLPKEIENLYLDDIDFLGLEYWYNDVAEVINSLKSKDKKE